jgi:hypothetical protein
MLEKLPFGANQALRSCLVDLLFEIPDKLDNPIKVLREYQNSKLVSHKDDIKAYQGDLEQDYLKYLGKVHRLAKEQPVEIEVDFRKYRS